MSPGWVVAGHVFLAPLLALSQPPWPGIIMLLVRSMMILLFLLVLWVLMTIWWRRRARRAESRDLRDWFIPVLLAGLGLLLLCSSDRGRVDHLFQRVDSMLMNGGFTEVPPDVTPQSWYDVAGIAQGGEEADSGEPFLPDQAELVTGETE